MKKYILLAYVLLALEWAVWPPKAQTTVLTGMLISLNTKRISG